MRRLLALPVLPVLVLLVGPAPSNALLVTYTVSMTGANEIPSGTGDPDGSASGTITLNDATGLISFSFSYANIDDPVFMHIHSGAAGVEGEGVPLVTLPVDALNVDPNPLVGSANPFPATVQSIIANPTAFYVNIHTQPFPDGAVRGQLGTLLPEPGAAALLAAPLLLLLARRR